VAGSVPTPLAIGWSVIALLAGWVVLGNSGVIAALAAIVVGVLVLLAARRRLGGITGDVLGAVIECSMTSSLLILALLLPHLS